MNWKDLLARQEHFDVPWVGGHTLMLRGGRRWTLSDLPAEHGWWRFEVAPGTCPAPVERVSPVEELLEPVRFGYLVGDRFVDESNLYSGYTGLGSLTRVHLVEPGIERFMRVSVGQAWEQGPLIFRRLEMPDGPEPDVMAAYDDRIEDISCIRGLSPALHAAYRIESGLRETREREAREAEERRAREERRRQLEAQIGNGALRREVARDDFAAGARAALAVGGAEFLDQRALGNGSFVVRFRLDRQRFECVVDSNLRIIDAGICLTAHYDDPEFRGGTKGDTWFSLESLPSVIREAEREDKLVVFRHV